MKTIELATILIQAALLAVPAADNKQRGPRPVRVINVDRITVNLVIRGDEYDGTEYSQAYVSFWNRPRYVAATGAAFPLWENRGWRIHTPDCGPYPLDARHARWACLFEGERLIVEANEAAWIVSDYDVEAEWPNCLWKRPIE